MMSNRESLSSTYRTSSAASGRGGSVGVGVYQSLLGPEDRAELEAFSAWYRTETTTKVVASYRTYLAKAWTADDVSKLTSSQRSALKKYAAFEALRASKAVYWMTGQLS